MSTTESAPAAAATSTLVAPSPARNNPFARPALPKGSGSFSRSCLLPTLPSPLKPTAIDATPAGKSTSVLTATSSAKGKKAWRLLWRGGLEIGPEGFRLEGITFFALLNFPSTPTQPVSNPFDVPISTPSHLPDPASSHSPFSLPSADTDICLSLESMRGRRYLHVRGVADLADTDILDSSDDSGGGGVQMSIAPTSYLLIAYFTGLLCRDAELSAAGRTCKAIMIGLGDDDSPQNTLLVYGQLQPGSSSLRLLVTRRRPPPAPPSAIKVRPGDPLPRVPLFFPAKARKPLPFPNRNTLAKSKSFSRTSSVSSIYAPPPVQPPSLAEEPNAPVSGRTPGRRGEKRPRTGAEDDERRRKAGKVVIVKEEATEVKQEPGVDVNEAGVALELPEVMEDIFGKRLVKMERGPSAQDVGGGGEPSTGKKRARVPQQVLDNKALIRKQAMVVLESRGYLRDHALFKDVFAMTTKGVYFVFRDALLDGPLDKMNVQHYVNGHLDMYLPVRLERSSSAVSGEDTAVDDETLISIKEEEGGEADEPIDWERTGQGENVAGILPLGLLDETPSKVLAERRRSSFSRSRSMDVVPEEDESILM